MAGWGFASTLMWNAEPKEIFQYLHENSLTEMECWAQHMDYRQFSEDEFADLADQYSINLCLHSYSWDLNPASMNEGIRKASVEEIKKAIGKAHRIGAREVTVHPGKMTLAFDREVYKNNMRASLKEIVDCAEEFNIKVSLEIMEKIPREIYTNLHKIQELAWDSPCYFTLDTAHCDSLEEILDILQLTDRLSKVHISNRKGSRYHTPLADGDIDFSVLVPELRSIDLPIIIEGLDVSRDFSVLNQNLKFLKNMEV